MRRPIAWACACALFACAVAVAAPQSGPIPPLEVDAVGNLSARYQARKIQVGSFVNGVFQATRAAIVNGLGYTPWPTPTATPIADTDYQIQSKDLVVSMTALTVTRTLTLPAAASFPAPRQLVIRDDSGAASAARQIIVQPLGADTIRSRSNPISLGSPSQRVVLVAGPTGWSY